MLNVAAEVRRLESLSIGQLQAEYSRVLGEPARSYNRLFLVKRIAWARQAAAQGGLSDRARARAAELAEGRGLRQRTPPDVREAHAAVTGAALRLVGTPGTEQPNQPSTPTTPTTPRYLPPVGSVITREYRGRRLEVQVVADGFVYEQQHFRSLSAVARHITGANWNGRLFFGVATR